ncbi:MAG: hypothetical protein LJE96_08020 [Deltaproteobacteria bacterium]|nr:hypothetical protein [Deltaproteobacteria bacterium]
MSSKDAYVQKLHAKLDEWNAQIDKMKAKADQAEADSRIEYNKRIGELREKRSETKEKLEALREAGEGAWEDLKSGVQLAVESMEQALNSAKARFK